MREIAQPVGYDELMGITEVWVDTALALGERSLDHGPHRARAGTSLGSAKRGLMWTGIERST